MYHFTTPPLGPVVILPSAIATANGPQAAAVSISDSESLTTNQLHNQLSEARRARDKMIEQVSRPPEPGWKSAMHQISDTVDHMEKVLDLLRSHVSALPASPATGSDPLAVYPSGVAMQQSGRTPDSPPSVAEAPAAPTAVSDPAAPPAAGPQDPNASAQALASSQPRVIYVMNDGVIIIGLPHTEADATTGTAEAASTASRDNSTDAAGRADPLQPPQSGAPMTANTVISLPLTEDQKRASADLIALAKKAYAYQAQPRDAQAAELISDENVGLTGALSESPELSAPDRPERAPVPRILTAELAQPDAGSQRPAANDDPLIAAAAPYARDPQREAAQAQEQQQILALQLDGHHDIIYIVPPAQAAIDLTA
ncbi:chemotaxis protein CheA [Tritonibacter mobilis]|uniref:chemotaxis protein CheA n=1 Tax=Tritonibacter mobilis TaxID=379347 RepID=UPI003A5BC1A5